ncbi:MAG: hypothetical protein AAFN78_15470 [Pseudomonadota bacterium]
MEIFLLLLDELDDVLSPLFAMAADVGLWRIVGVVAAAGTAITLNSPIVLAAGALLAAASGTPSLLGQSGQEPLTGEVAAD